MSARAPHRAGRRRRRDDDIDDAVGDRQVLDFTQPEINVAVAALGCDGARAADHFGGHIDADNETVVTNRSGGEEAVDATTAAQIHHRLARSDLGVGLADFAFDIV